MVDNDQQVLLFTGQFDNGSDQYYEQIEDQLRQSAESINDQMVTLVDQWKQMQSSRIQQNYNQHIMVVVNSIKQKYGQIINETEQIIKQQWNRYH